MISKSEIKRIRSLNMKKQRESLGLFIVEGEKMVEEAIRSGFGIESIYRLEDIGEVEMRKITQLSSPSPILAVVRKPLTQIDIKISPKGISLALDSVRDPGNMGTIIRIADWFGIEDIYVSKDSVDIYNPKVVQSSMGAIFRKQVTYIDLKDIVSTYLDSKTPIYGTFLEGNNIYKESLNKENALIVMGSENNGISPEIASMVTDKLYIPTYPISSETSESLNVAIATAIICSEFRR